MPPRLLALSPLALLPFTLLALSPFSRLCEAQRNPTSQYVGCVKRSVTQLPQP
ncbi:hypothetical protein NIES39_L02900 [Arthrospira platensis NIES-39]|nr:hypothetical protein NIES39_L02900 [Arthrospira platensis NIES-39]